MILKPFFLVGDVEIINAPSTVLTKLKKSAKAKVVGFLARPSKTKKLACDRRPTFAPLIESTPALAAPKPIPRRASISPIDLVAARGRADETWAKAEKHDSRIYDIQALFDRAKIGNSRTPSPLSSSSSSSGFYTSTSATSMSWRGQSGIPSPVGTPSPSPRSYTPTRRSLCPFSRPSSPASSPALSSILVNEVPDPRVAFSENGPEVKASDASRDSAKQDNKMNVDVAVDAFKTKCDLLNEQNTPTEELSRAVETIQELMALVRRQAKALEVQKAEIRHQQQTLPMLADQMLELEKRPIRLAKASSLAPGSPAAYDINAIIKTIVNEIAANATPAVCPSTAKYLDKDDLKDIIKRAAMELFASVPATSPLPPPPPPLVPSPRVSKTIKSPVVAKKSMIPRACAQADPKFLEELTATIKSFNASSSPSVSGSQKISPAPNSCPSPRSRNRIPLRHRSGLPSNSSNRSSAAASPAWNRSSLRPSRNLVVIPTKVSLDPARKFTMKSPSVTRLSSFSTTNKNAVNSWGRRVNATIHPCFVWKPTRQTARGWTW